MMLMMMMMIIIILWDMPIQKIMRSKPIGPDIVIKNKKKGCVLTDLAIPTDGDTSVKATEKQSKYKDLEIDIERMWRMKAKTIPVVIGALGLKRKAMDEYIQKTPGGVRIQELWNITLLRMSHILKKALSIK